MSAQETTEELADVVVAASNSTNKRSLRPWGFCLLFLLIVEGATRIYFDTGISLHHERFDNFPTGAAQDAFIRQIGRDTAYKIVMIGDSTVDGVAILNKDQTIARELEAGLMRQLPGKDIHVWNMSIAGARPTDQLCMFTKIAEAKPDLVIFTANYITAEEEATGTGSTGRATA